MLSISSNYAFYKPRLIKRITLIPTLPYWQNGFQVQAKERNVINKKPYLAFISLLLKRIAYPQTIQCT
jgi:hypothetical protein